MGSSSPGNPQPMFSRSCRSRSPHGRRPVPSTSSPSSHSSYSSLRAAAAKAKAAADAAAKAAAEAAAKAAAEAEEDLFWRCCWSSWYKA